LTEIPALSWEDCRLLVESIGDYAIFMLDTEGRVTTWNRGAEKIKGYSAEEIIGQHFSRFYPPEEGTRARLAEQLVLAAERGHVELEGWRVRRDGTRFWGNVVITALRDSSGVLRGFAKVTRDLTARREAEETARELEREQVARVAAEASERALRESHDRYEALSRRLQQILEGVPDGISVQAASGALLFANTAAARACGFTSVDELLRAPVEEVVARFEVLDEQGEPLPGSHLPGRLVLDGASMATATVRVRDRATGHEWWSRIRASAITEPDGTPDLAVNIWHDVTDERLHEERERTIADATAVLSSSLDYPKMMSTLARVLVPRIGDWCAIHLLEGERIANVAVAHVDPQKVALAEDMQRTYPPDPARATGVWNVLRSGTSELYDEVTDRLLVERARDPQHLAALRALGIKSAIVAPIRMRNRIAGTITLVSTESGRRFRAEDVTLVEEIGHRAGTAIDNAKLYAAERKAREQLELLAHAGEAFSAALDYQETLRNVVHLALPVLGDYAFFDVVEGSTVRRVAAVHDEPEIDALVNEAHWTRSESDENDLHALSSGQPEFHPDVDDSWLFRFTKSGDHLALLRRLRVHSIISVPLRARGEVLGALTLCLGKSARRHTVEDLRLAEELARRAAVAVMQARLYEAAQDAARRAEEAARRAEEASRIKDEFLATVSHELRTPLHAIIGWSTLLLERSLDPTLAKGIEVIHRNAQAQGKLVEDILDVSRVITGKLRLELQPTDLAAIVRDAIEVVRASAVAKGIAIDFAPHAERFIVVADPERLQQVVWNLLSNAVKFTDPGGRVTIGIRREGSKLTISVSDTGRGIEPDFLPYVFDRFKQADSSTTRRVGGLGLGLAIVRHIVELHGGQVQAASEGPGEGATFVIALPVRALAPTRRDDPTPAHHGGESASHPLASLDGLCVLVVDDEPDARELVHAVLASAGAKVEGAAGAVEGLKRLRELRPHVVVSDVGMPEVDGYTFVRNVRAIGTDVAETPCIALTAYTRPEEQLEAIAAGFTAHVGKPVNPDDLVATVARIAARAGKPP
jgi:PAS domain S-box-containing protein